MIINKTFVEKAHLFARLKKRWTALPDNWILEVMESEVNETTLNKVRSDNFNQEVKRIRAEHDRKKNTNG